MSAPNGHAQKDHVLASSPPPAMRTPGVFQIPAERVKELVAALEVPFDSSQTSATGPYVIMPRVFSWRRNCLATPS